MTAAMSEITTKLLQFHPLAKKYGGNLNKSELDALAKDIADNGQRFPIVVHNGEIIEGIQRYRACLRIKKEPIIAPYDVERYGGEEKDIEAFIISANIHRRHDTKRKRAFIAALLKADPTASNRKIAETAKVDKNTVANQRKKMESTGEIHQLKKTVGKDNKPRTTKPRRASEPRPTKTTVRVDADSEPKFSRLADVSTLNATWNAASREQRRAFVNEIGLVELYAQASNAQQQKLADMIRDMDAKEATRPNRQRRSDGSRK
jgi:hypothetical protein